ncbi:DUF3311 domain-containing protein [Arthrobacter sp. M4]|uniref:DUF3311 domain-containing protein n=1 Tax=Arthrobacter sp. M4 TaxID=218160 RepID=UPI001CDC63D1|nr:DUF3311 domain-containing protein [Arthrobacter sp. M4]MCA4133337.1 DUF3311 domain-containing protein [Arthrobacter sp. M4]
MSRHDGPDPNHHPNPPVPRGRRLTRETPTRGPARRTPYVIAGILLAAAILLPLLPQTYSFAAPRVGGMPFFYWYQLLWVPISAALSGIAYWLVTTEDRRRRAAARAASLPAEGQAGTASEGDQR